MNISARSLLLRIFPPSKHAARVVSVVSAIRDWTVDRQRERRIRELRARISAAFAVRDELSVRHLAREMFAECDARSERQKLRMERRLLDSLDPHARQVLGK